MHAVRRELVEAQAAAAGLPLWTVNLPWPCSNDEYEQRMRTLLTRAREHGVSHFAFGDLFLEDVRNYRIRLLEGSGIAPLFPLWGPAAATPQLAKVMLAAGLRAVITCVDPKQLDGQFIGQEFDADLLAKFPATVDPCGERGEFHTFCYAGPDVFESNSNKHRLGCRARRLSFHGCNACRRVFEPAGCENPRIES